MHAPIYQNIIYTIEAKWRHMRHYISPPFLIEINIFQLRTIHLEIASTKWGPFYLASTWKPFYLSLGVLTECYSKIREIIRTSARDNILHIHWMGPKIHLYQPFFKRQILASKSEYGIQAYTSIISYFHKVYYPQGHGNVYSIIS